MKPRLVLITKSLPTGTFGELLLDGQRLCFTAEREWNNNAKGKSCIPAGLYTLMRHHSPRFGDCFAVENANVGVTVQGPSQRTHCLVHAANFPRQLEGCIAPGTEMHPSQWGVAHSVKALNALKQELGSSDWPLEVIRL
ncbi:DUF5675 family protein [Ferrimonas senticii]|uniref:DUF5675 family protein n=1 Tax=Ferrimonas senticii TaxID=394566 RepID=UPI0004884E0E|nr:DUF5675 family protein [Ferrimonas senticii]